MIDQFLLVTAIALVLLCVLLIIDGVLNQNKEEPFINYDNDYDMDGND